MLRRGLMPGLLVASLLLVPATTHALILRLTPLGDVLKEGQYICVANVEKLYPEKPAAVLVVTEDLKGKLPFRRLPVNLAGDAEGKKLDHPAQILKRLAPDLPVVLFANHFGKNLIVF